MKWRYVHASEVGTSHLATGRPCEDSCWSMVDATTAGINVLSVFVADGAGSAPRGGAGADETIQAAAAFVASKLRTPEFAFNDETAVELVMSVRERLYALAEQEKRTPRDFACTFVGVVSSVLGTLVMQVGDGGAVIDVGNGLEVAVVPMTGEYANMTHFVTDEDAVSVLATKSYPAVAKRVAVFSDGLQRLALNMSDNTAHTPFFSPFFKVLADSNDDQDGALHAALSQFLSSDKVNERTDDDKSLALAVLVE